MPAGTAVGIVWFTADLNADEPTLRAHAAGKVVRVAAPLALIDGTHGDPPVRASLTTAQKRGF
jgi:hypothetical protein